MYTVKKTYGHELGLSATFRQWRADSHCRFIHGYALGFTLEFGCNDEDTDLRNWVINFGGLKPIKAWLEQMFDHKTLIAEDDPALKVWMSLDASDGKPFGQLMQVNIVEGVGCESFAKIVFDKVTSWLAETEGNRVSLISVECREHAGNSATYRVGRFSRNF